MKNDIADDVHRLIEQAERWLRLEAADKMVVVTTYAIVGAVLFALITSAVFFISMGVMKTIAMATGNEMASCYIVGGALLLIALVFYLMRKSLVESKVVESVSTQMLEEEDNVQPQ